MTDFIDRLLARLLGTKASSALPPSTTDSSVLTYEQARDLARTDDVAARRKLAQRTDLRPEILYYLADDPSAEVRRQVAANPATPPQADLHLAADSDPSVRGDLARKIARLAPGLTADEQDRLRRMTYEALLLLARDQIARVRQILAEALKDVANAPPEVIRELAHDSELIAAGPILESSPVLTDEDLLEIIQGCPVNGALAAISRRQSVAEPVADAIARTEDIDAIAVLLANPSAQIREETLDLLLDQAPAYEVWHGPLVRRPQLSARAATRLARFVADSLLQVLQERADFDEATKVAVAAVVRRRVEEGGADMAAFDRNREKAERRAETPWEIARRKHLAGELKAPVVMTALRANDLEFVVCALAVLAGVSVERVRKIVSTQSAKGMTALAWQAGLSMSNAIALQTQLAKIAPTDVLQARPGTRSYPLDAEEMTWQMEFFAALVGEQRAAAIETGRRPKVIPQ